MVSFSTKPVTHRRKKKEPNTYKEKKNKKEDEKKNYQRNLREAKVHRDTYNNIK